VTRDFRRNVFYTIGMGRDVCTYTVRVHDDSKMFGWSHSKLTPPARTAFPGFILTPSPISPSSSTKCHVVVCWCKGTAGRKAYRDIISCRVFQSFPQQTLRELYFTWDRKNRVGFRVFRIRDFWRPLRNSCSLFDFKLSLFQYL